MKMEVGLYKIFIFYEYFFYLCHIKLNCAFSILIFFFFFFSNFTDSDGEHKKSRRRERKGRTRADVVTESGGDGGEGGEGAASSGGWSLHIGEKRGLSGSGSHSKQEGGKIAIGNRTVETEEDGE